ncbi:MAG: sulfotransferase domain-containing protein [Pseudomonadota bacterium]
MATKGTNGAAAPGTVGTEAEPLPRSLVWIASYPGSGALHLYAMLMHYLMEHDAPIAPGPIAKLATLESDPAHYVQFFNRPMAEMTAHDQMYARQRLLAQIARRGRMHLLCTNNRNATVADLALAPPGITRLAIYVARDPRDVAVSLMRLTGESQAAVMAHMAERNWGLPGSAALMPRLIGAWDDHVASWSTEKRYPVVSLRHEDIVARPAEVLALVVRSLDIPFDEAMIRSAADEAALDRLSAEEDGESAPGVERFGDIGPVGQWRDVLDPEPALILSERFGEAMRRLRYLN